MNSFLRMRSESSFPARIYTLAIIGLMTVVNGWANEGSPQNNYVLKVATFDIDATPPVGTEMAYNPVLDHWDMGLRARGVVLIGTGQPVVLVALDWLVISNDSHLEFQKAIAEGAGTIPSRVVVHTLHQHDAPRSDFSAEKILKNAGINPVAFEGTFARGVIQRLKSAVRESLSKAQPVTHLGLGKAEVHQVASNRRILDNGGQLRAGRMSASKDASLRAKPEGTVDPYVSIVSFWNENKPVAALSYYATHPQSYYRTNVPSPDFPGIARFHRQLELPDVLHVHFTGAAGNVAAGKYNDGSKENRGILASRLEDGMKRAWESTVKKPITAKAIGWQVETVVLPPAPRLQETLDNIATRRQDKAFLTEIAYHRNAAQLAWLERWKAGKPLEVSCLTLGDARILHMPGELFVEYQLAAKAMRPDLFVVMAAYVDGGPGYIGTAVAYDQGGYEITVSNVGPESETILTNAMRKLLQAK